MQNGKSLMLHCYKVTMLQTAVERLNTLKDVYFLGRTAILSKNLSIFA